MNVLYTCDNNYVWLMGISTISLFENNKHIEELSVYLLGENISENNKGILREIGANYQRNIIIIDVPKLDIPPSLVSTRWPLSAFTRLFAGQLLPDSLDRVLYLDCDTVIVGDIEPLNGINFDGKVVMGVKDCISGFYKKNIGLEKESPYINAGVLLLNLNVLREIDINKKVESFMSKYVKLINYADQDILNGTFKGEIGILKPKYDVMTIAVVHSYKEILKLRKPTNYYTENELQSAVSSPVIIHYTTNMLVVRPWFSNSDHPLKDEFKSYMNKSIWKDIQLKVMSFNSKESRIISVINRLPRSMAYSILGFVHSELKPLYIRIKRKLVK